MATIVERNGRFTSQIRLRGFRSRARTFDTHADALAWGKATEAAMISGASVEEPTPAQLSEGAYSHSGVYFLYSGSTCVYVGQSLNVHRRVKDHRRKIDFDTYSWMPVAPAQLPIIEQMYIKAMRPIHNHIYVVRESASCGYGRPKVDRPESMNRKEQAR